MKHEFWELLKQCNKNKGAFGNKTERKGYYSLLRESHPFVFDKKCTDIAMDESSAFEPLDEDLKAKRVRDIEYELDQIVENFSLPFKNTLYILTNPHLIISQDDHTRMKIYGYLIKEDTPENFEIYTLQTVAPPEHEEMLPAIQHWGLNLRNIKTVEEAFLIMRLTQMISVKRIGVEKGKRFEVKSKGIGMGRTVLKYDNVYHIADKVEYEYVKPLNSNEINWEWCGWWRGHWRAFYAKDDYGENLRDRHGRNAVDYGRIGKDRAGDYCVAGYTWVKEHIKGNPDLAEIKTHYVVGE